MNLGRRGVNATVKQGNCMSDGIKAVDERLSSLDNASLVALNAHVPLDALRTRFDKGVVVVTRC